MKTMLFQTLFLLFLIWGLLPAMAQSQPVQPSKEPLQAVPVGPNEGSIPAAGAPANANLLPQNAYNPMGAPEDAFLDSYEGTYTCLERQGTRLRLDLTHIEPGINFPVITGQFTLIGADGQLRVQGPLRARSASLSSRRLVLELSYDAFRDAGLQDYWVRDWQVYVSPDLSEIESRREGCNGITLSALEGSLAPRNDTGTAAGGEMAAAQFLNWHSVEENCRVARSRNQIGTCIFQSILFEAGPGSIRNYRGSVLRIMLPSNPLVPSSTTCRFAINELRSDMSALGMAVFDTRNRRLEFVNTDLTCRSVGFLRTQLFGETLSLSDCTPDTANYVAFRDCLDQFIEIYAPDRLARMQLRAEETFQAALGIVPDVISSSFLGDAHQEVVAAVNSDAEWCRRGVLNPDLLNIGNDPYGRATGGYIAAMAFSQLDTAQIDNQALDWHEMQGRVSCEDVMQLLSHFTDAEDDLLAEYQALAADARAEMCASGRSEEGPSERLLAVALNSYLVSHCSNAGFLSFWLEDAANGRDPQGNPIGFALVDFDGSNNQCRMRSRLTTSFSQPELSFRVSQANVVGQSRLGDGRFALDVDARLSCRSNSDSPVRNAMECGIYAVAPAPFSLVASWSDASCEWQVSAIERRR